MFYPRMSRTRVEPHRAVDRIRGGAARTALGAQQFPALLIAPSVTVGTQIETRPPLSCAAAIQSAQLDSA